MENFEHFNKVYGKKKDSAQCDWTLFLEFLVGKYADIDTSICASLIVFPEFQIKNILILTLQHIENLDLHHIFDMKITACVISGNNYPQLYFCWNNADNCNLNEHNYHCK